MGTYKTTFAIGDLVYTASKRGIDREVIKAIKITTLKEDVAYGIERKEDGGYFSSLWGFGSGDGYSWYKESEIFSSKQNAVARHENLKLIAEAEEAKEKLKEKAARKKQLKRELYNLEHDIEDDDDEEEY